MTHISRWTVAGIVVILLIVLVGCGSSSGSNVQKYKMNEDVTVGKAIWHGLNVEKKTEIVGNTGSGAKAEGVYILVEAQVKNLSSETLMITGIEVEIMDDQNNSYSFDSRNNGAFLESMGRENLVNHSIAPGATDKGWVVFDIKKDAQGLKLKVRDLDIRSSKYGIIDLNL